MIPGSRTLRAKLLAGVLLTNVVVLLVATGALMTFDLSSYRDQLASDMTAQAALVGRAAAGALRAGDARAAQASLGLLQARARIRAAAIYGANGARFASYVRGGGGSGFPSLPGADGFSRAGDTLVIFKRVVRDNEILGTVYLVAEYSPLARVRRYAIVAASVAAVTLALSLLLSLWLQRRVTRPIQEVSGLARAVIERRDYSLRAKRLSDDEVGTLVDAFNDMLVEIERRTAGMLEANRRLEDEVAQRRRVGEALAGSEARYRSLVEATSQIIWVADARGAIVGPVPSWQAYTGQSEAEVQGDGWTKALHPEDAPGALAAWRAAVDSESVFQYEYRVRGSDGVYHWFSVRGVPVRAEDGSIREWVRVCTDINERRRAEHAVRQLNEQLEARVRERTAQLEEANRELEAFSYSVSHDLRAPLRAVDGFSQALIEDCPEFADERMRRYLDRIRAATLHMAQLIDDLLNLSRISRVALEPVEVDLSALARAVLNSLRQREPEREIELGVWDDISARGDPRLLRVVLENLLANAWKFTGKTAGARIEFGALREPHRTVYFVRDNGAGFDMAHAERLFGAFQRLHAASEFSGTGVGLATVQRVVHRHGGTIWAHARPGKGATFFFTLGSSAPREAARDAQAPGQLQ